MIFDTHCHLNFSAFDGIVDETIQNAVTKGVGYFVVPGTDVATSKKAIEIAQKHKNIYAAVGIHPHHLFELKHSAIGGRGRRAPDSAQGMSTGGREPSDRIYRALLKQTEQLLIQKKVVAVGEIGVDRHYYQSTKYKNYRIDESFMTIQKEFLAAQIKLAVKYKKSVILHNREAKQDLLDILADLKSLLAHHPLVIHCCEPDEELLAFAKKHNVMVGVDGDVTYDEKKQEFVKKIPLELLVLETDSPYLLPEPQRSKRMFPNHPANLILIAEKIAVLKKVSFDRLAEMTTNNAKLLFQITS